MQVISFDGVGWKTHIATLFSLVLKKIFSEEMIANEGEMENGRAAGHTLPTLSIMLNASYSLENLKYIYGLDFCFLL